MRNFRKLALLAPVAGLLAMGPAAAPVGASGLGGGTLAFKVTAPLPAFPCGSSPTDSCTPLVPAEGPLYFTAASGDDSGTAWSFAGSNLANNAAVSTYVYWEPSIGCNGTLGTPALGGAEGTTVTAVGTAPAADGSGGPAGGTIRGTWHNAAIPQANIGGAYTSSSFFYQRVGVTAVITFTGVTTTLYDSQGAALDTVITNGNGAAAALFIADHGSPNCSGNPFTVDVAGVAELSPAA
jgi:hypothetical protein